MGQKPSVHHVRAFVSVPKALRLDTIRLTYPKRSCLGKREKQIASFSFLESEWQELGLSALRNSSSRDAEVSLGKLYRKAKDTTVNIVFLSGGSPVVKASLPLGDLLASLWGNQNGKICVLYFTLASLGQHGLALCCNKCICITDAVKGKSQVQGVKDGDGKRADDRPERSSAVTCNTENVSLHQEAGKTDDLISLEYSKEMHIGNDYTDDSLEYITPPLDNPETPSPRFEDASHLPQVVCMGKSTRVRRRRAQKAKRGKRPKRDRKPKTDQGNKSKVADPREVAAPYTWWEVFMDAATALSLLMTPVLVIRYW